MSNDPEAACRFLAEKLLGWEWRDSGKIVGWVQTDGKLTESRQLIDLYTGNGMVEIIEAMCARNYVHSTHTLQTPKYQATFYHLETIGGPIIEAEADSLAEAVMLAAVNALSSESAADG